MSELRDPGLPEDHPRQRYHHNLTNLPCISWHSSTASPKQVIKYAFGLLGGIALEDLVFFDDGTAAEPSDSLHFAALQGPAGSLITAWGFDADGAARLNRAVETEYDQMIDEMKRGVHRGNSINGARASMENGRLQEHFFVGDPKFFEIVNGAQLISIFDTVMFNEGAG